MIVSTAPEHRFRPPAVACSGGERPSDLFEVIKDISAL